jgi:hypothetical protein
MAVENVINDIPDISSKSSWVESIHECPPFTHYTFIIELKKHAQIDSLKYFELIWDIFKYFSLN